MTHPHCYATEGFLYAYHVTKRKDFLEVTKKASGWLNDIQNDDGSFYRIYSSGKNDDVKPMEENKTSDAIAQATRIWKLLGANKEGIKKAYAYLDGESKGGGLRLLNSSTLMDSLFSWRRPIYSWPTFFYIHSLLLPFGEIEYSGEIF